MILITFDRLDDAFIFYSSLFIDSEGEKEGRLGKQKGKRMKRGLYREIKAARGLNLNE